MRAKLLVTVSVSSSLIASPVQFLSCQGSVASGWMSVLQCRALLQGPTKWHAEPAYTMRGAQYKPTFIMSCWSATILCREAHADLTWHGMPCHDTKLHGRAGVVSWQLMAECSGRGLGRIVVLRPQKCSPASYFCLKKSDRTCGPFPEFPRSCRIS